MTENFAFQKAKQGLSQASHEQLWEINQFCKNYFKPLCLTTKHRHFIKPAMVEINLINF